VTVAGENRWFCAKFRRTRFEHLAGGVPSEAFGARHQHALQACVDAGSTTFWGGTIRLTYVFSRILEP
jgi:hypothetical protein